MEATPEAGGLDFDGALCAVGVGVPRSLGSMFEPARGAQKTMV